MHTLPSSLSTLLASSPVVGFSGSRAPRLASRAALASVLRTLPGHVPAVVGCARGIDTLVRATRPSALVVQAAGHAPGLLAARSSHLVRHVAALSGLLVAFPAAPCPSGLTPSRSPSRCFSGHGSGTWSSVALAVGLGCGALVYLPPGIAPPAWLSTSHALPSGWHLHRSTAAQTVLL